MTFIRYRFFGGSYVPEHDMGDFIKEIMQSDHYQIVMKPRMEKPFTFTIEKNHDHKQ